MRFNSESSLELLARKQTKQGKDSGTLRAFGRPRAFVFHVEHTQHKSRSKLQPASTQQLLNLFFKQTTHFCNIRLNKR
jgi:hypothetical protein